MLSLALPGTSWAHRLPAGMKLGALAVVMVGALRLTSVPAVALALGAMAGLYASLGPGAARAGLRALGRWSGSLRSSCCGIW